MNIMGRLLDTVKSIRAESSSGRITTDKLTPAEKKELAELNKMTNIGSIENSMKKKYGATVDTESAKKIAKEKGSRAPRNLGENIKQ